MTAKRPLTNERRAALEAELYELSLSPSSGPGMLDKLIRERAAYIRKILEDGEEPCRAK